MVGCLPAFAVSIRTRTNKYGTGSNRYSGQPPNNSTLRNESILLEDVEKLDVDTHHITEHPKSNDIYGTAR
jgi:hypothetical protein